jgi:hypothetical protein
MATEGWDVLADALAERVIGACGAGAVRDALAAHVGPWPAEHVIGPDEVTPVPFHLGQRWAWESERRIVAVCAGTQSGKTAWGPWWLAREIERCGRGDYLAITSVYDLFKMKMLPALLLVFEQFLPRVWRDDGLAFRGRYWAGDRVIEVCDPETGRFLAERSTDAMWARVILRSADAKGGLEAGTVKAAWLDEAGQDRFTADARKAILRRLAIHRGRELITTTLYNLGWVKTQIIDRAQKGGEVVLETLDNGAELERTDNAAEDICLVQFDSIVNPAYPMEEFEAARATMPDDEFAMFWRGRVARLRDLIYDCFDTKRHLCPRFPIKPDWKRYVGMDFGGANTAAVFYAEEPTTRRLYAYREYLEGRKTAVGHVAALLHGEPGIPLCVGGSKSEGQWRQEFAAAGLPILGPAVHDVDLGINRVYGCHRRDEIIYFDDLTGVIDQKGRYRRKRDRSGNPTGEIQDKRLFHYLDAERYIISYIRGDAGAAEGALAAAQDALAAGSRWTQRTTPRWKRTRR